MAAVSPEIHARVIDRLIATGKADEPWALIVLAAMEGATQLDAYLDKKASIAAPQKTEIADVVISEPPGAYVSSITVEGFRGVGPAAALTLRPGPGLTLVVGRNGSGKSSFAEGLEFLLTGRNYRWEKRSKVWLEGWRNLHHDRTALKSELLVEGRGSVAVSRAWKSNDFAANQVAVSVQTRNRPHSRRSDGATRSSPSARFFPTTNSARCSRTVPPNSMTR